MAYHKQAEITLETHFIVNTYFEFKSFLFNTLER